MKMALLLAAVVLSASAADPRYCGAPERTDEGRIARSRAVLAEFRRLYPCPSTGLIHGSCPGWAIDHVIPLACGGCDAVVNLQWLPLPIKSASGTLPKDRWERRIYCVTR
jgi:hypothetical protein